MLCFFFLAVEIFTPRIGCVLEVILHDQALCKLKTLFLKKFYHNIS